MQTTRPRVVMLVNGPCAPDPRVLREARALAADYAVEVWAADRRGRLARREELGGIPIERVHAPADRLHAGFEDWLTATPARVASVEQPWRAALTNPGLLALKGLRRGLVDLSQATSLWLHPAARRALTAEPRPAVIHCHDLDTLLLGLGLAKLLGAKVVFDAHEDFAALHGFLHGPLAARGYGLLESLLAPRVDALIVCGERMAASYRERSHAPVDIVGNWKDPADYAPRPEQVHPGLLAAREAGQLVVSYLSGLGRNRVFAPLISAARADPRLFLAVAGGRPGEAFAKRIRAELEALPNAAYLGWLEEERLNAHFAASDVVVQLLDPRDPNHRFAAPNTLFAAIAAGRASLGVDLGEVGRILREERCGIALPEPGEAVVHEALGRLADRSLLVELQANARQAAERYCWARAAETLREVYRRLLGR